jgi:hypothetical protein
MDTSTYIRKILTDHLLNTGYRQLSPIEEKNAMDNLKHYLKSLITRHQSLLPKPELTFFQCSFQNFHRLPMFYGLPKVHKTPFTLCPIVSSTNGFLAIFSTWLDYKMKALLPLVKSFIKNSFSVIGDFRDIDLPPEAKLFSADATLMYTNINTLTGVTSIKHFLSDNRENLPVDFPTKLFLHILYIVMDNNVFCFGNTYWLQLSGAAMGMPAACAYATISYGQHKNAVILPTFSSNLLYFKRYINDIFGIWLPPSNNKLATWEAFKTCINNWGSLSWVIEEPSTTTNSLDLNLTITGSRISTATFQKRMNLCLCIPPASAHPPSCFKRLIAGELRRYWLQNDANNFKEILSKFII